MNFGVLSDIQFGKVKTKGSGSNNGIGQGAGVGNPRQSSFDEVIANGEQFSLEFCSRNDLILNAVTERCNSEPEWFVPTLILSLDQVV